MFKVRVISTFYEVLTVISKHIIIPIYRLTLFLEAIMWDFFRLSCRAAIVANIDARIQPES